MPLTAAESRLETKCERLARLITRQYGIRVLIQGRVAKIDLDNRVVVLPCLSDMEVDALRDHLDGMLDHECAHILFTDPEVVRDTREPLYTFWNAIEDTWVERRIGDCYVGCRENLDKINSAMDGYLLSCWDKIPERGKLLYAIGRCGRRIEEVDRFLRMPGMRDLLGPVEGLLREVHRVSDTAGALALAKRFLEELGVEGEKESEEESEEKLEEELKKEGDGAASYDVEWFFNCQLVPDASVDWEGGSGGEDEPPAYLVFSTAYDTDTTYVFEDRSEHSALYQKLKSEVHEYIGAIAIQLELALLARAESRWVGGATRGRRWDRRALPRWYLGIGGDAVFSRKEQGERIDTAVSMLWDCSGSMGHAQAVVPKKGRINRSTLARLAAVAFHEALLRANIPHEVLGFNTSEACPPGLLGEVDQARKAGQDLRIFSRLDEVDKRMVFVPFGGSDGRAICEISGWESNRDGECVLWAAQRLARRSERRKVLLVGSDGIPQGAVYPRLEKRYLKEAVSRVEAAGIEIVGIGISHAGVRDYYPRWVVIDRVKDLPGIVMRQLFELLT